MPVWLGSGDNPLWDCRLINSCCVLTLQKGLGNSLGPHFYGHWSHSRPKHLPKAPPPNTVTWALGFQHMHFRGHWHSDHSSGYVLVSCCFFGFFFSQDTTHTWCRVKYFYKTYFEMAGLPNCIFSSPEASTLKFFSYFFWQLPLYI